MTLSACLRSIALLVALAAVTDCARDVFPVGSDATRDDASNDASDATPARDATPLPADLHWARDFADGIDVVGIDLAVSRGGQVAVVGAFRQSVDFGLGPLVATHPRTPYDLFVVVFDAGGHAVWNRNLRGSFSLGNYQPSVAFAGEDLVLAGSFEDTLSLDVGQGPLVGPDHSSVFATRFDGTGRVVWTRVFGNRNGVFVFDVGADSAGNVFLSGRFYGTINFGFATYNGATGVADNGFILKLDSNGVPLASAAALVNGGMYSSMALNPSGGVTIVGSLVGTANFGVTTVTCPGPYKLFAAAYDSDLHLTFARRIGVSGDSVEQTLGSVATDADGSLLITGWSTGPIDFGGGPLFPPGAYGSYVVRLDAHGDRLWDRVLGPTMDRPRVVGGDASQVVIAGALHGDVDLGLGSLSGPDSGSMFVMATFDANGATVANHVFAYAPARNEFGGFARVSATDVVLMGNFSGTADVGLGPVRGRSGFEDLLLARIAVPTGAR